MSRLVILLVAAACSRESSGPAARDSFSRASVDLSTGITMAYVEAGAPAGEPVILLHGITDSSTSFLQTIRHVARLRPDLRLIAVDLRGHGGSSMPPADPCRDAPEQCFRPADFASDVLAFMDEKGIPDAHFVGHSLGSFVGQEIALGTPRRVRRLVLIATAAKTSGNPVIREFLLAGLVEGPWKDTVLRRGSPFPGSAYGLIPLDVDPDAQEWMAKNWVVDPAADPEFLAGIVPETSRVRIGTWLGAARALLAVDNTERLTGLTVPTLVIWATQDNFFPAADQASLRSSLDAAAEQCRMGYFWKQYGRKPLPASGEQEDDLGHNTHWGAPEATARDLAAYLRENGEPTDGLPYADPSNVRRVVTAPGEAVLVARPARNCPPGAGK